MKMKLDYFAVIHKRKWGYEGKKYTRMILLKINTGEVVAFTGSNVRFNAVEEQDIISIGNVEDHWRTPVITWQDKEYRNVTGSFSRMFRHTHVSMKGKTDNE